MDREGTLVELLRRRADAGDSRGRYMFLGDGARESGRHDYPSLERRASALAARISEQARPGDRALLLFPPGLGFVEAFFGCLFAGVVAVPAYPPRPNRSLERLQAIRASASPGLCLSDRATIASLSSRLAEAPELAATPWIAVEDVDDGQAAIWRPRTPAPDDVAFLQYTSGSTSAPKGVMVSHGNILRNQEMIRAGFGYGGDTVVVGWLPLYHDMGLIGNLLQPLFLGVPCVLMPPAAFLQRPIRWIEAVARYGATTSGGPNFAYDLCVEAIDPAKLEGVDLSRWRVAFNGAEPVRRDTIARFVEAFAPFGFRREAFYPCYGLAEATLIVSGGVPGEEPKVFSAEADALGRGLARRDEGISARPLVGSGRSLPGQDLRIVEPETGDVCRPREVGEIQVSGPHVARGYWGLGEASAEAFGALPEGGDAAGTRFLRTGDLGFLDEDGELYVVGRIKDLIIVRGRNHYPQDIEHTVAASHAGLRGACAAFSVEVEDEERLVVVAETRRPRLAAPEADEILRAAAAAVLEAHEVRLHGLVLVRSHAIPKTSSGKLRRLATREAYLAGTLPDALTFVLEV